jgi:DNA uptake protein ComE-like DNA-binding protein
MHATDSELQQILVFAPEWTPLWRRVEESGIAAGAVGLELGKNCAQMCAFFTLIGARSLFNKIYESKQAQSLFLKPIRDCYFIPLATKMFRSNGNLRRFTSEKHFTIEQSRSLQMSLATEVAVKLETALRRQIDDKKPDGFKVLLQAYIQTSVNNAVIDHIKQECHWDRQTLNDSYESGEEESPIDKAADDLALIPEQLILSKEKVQHLNDLRKQLVKLVQYQKELDPALAAVDCIFGLGLTKYSKTGCEMTMRECCEALALQGETPARRIARCQVLLDRGMNAVRDMLRNSLPEIIQCWQQEVNVNVASRRDLNHQLNLTEGEIERLIVSRQYLQLEQLVDRLIIKKEKLATLKEKGAVAAFVPVDLNSATVRDLIDILGLPKEEAQTLCSKRPFARMEQLLQSGLLSSELIDKAISRGAVLKQLSDCRLDLNKCSLEELSSLELPTERVNMIMRGRPFTTWDELEEFLGFDESTWLVLRENFRLSLNSA